MLHFVINYFVKKLAVLHGKPLSITFTSKYWQQSPKVAKSAFHITLHVAF